MLDNGQDTFLTSGWGGYLHLVQFTDLTPGEQIDSVAIKIATPAGNIRYKVYQDNGFLDNPATLLGETNSIPAQVGTVYNSLNNPVIIPASGTVWVGFEVDSHAMQAYYSPDGVRKHIVHTFGDGPNPAGSVSTTTHPFWAGIEITGS